MDQSTATNTRMTDAETGYVSTEPADLDDFPMGEVLKHPGRHDEHIMATASWEYEGVKGEWDGGIRLEEYAEDETHSAHLHLSMKAGDSLPFGGRLWMMDAEENDLSVRFASLDDVEEFGLWLCREANRLHRLAGEVEL